MTIAHKISARAKAVFAAALAVCLVSVSSPAAFAQAPAGAVQQQNVAKVQDEVRGVLSQYGRFVQHAKYGEVWIPTVTPPGWHPYPPCHWVNSRKYGWYYDDKTPWGEIVHHYGRWVSDPQMGWIWTPGAEFSPAWVVWRTSPEWVGWAPMLPDEDVQTVAAADFNNAAYWIFVETQKFAQGCNGATQAPPSQIPVLLTRTTYVTDIQLVFGITVIVLPQYVVGPLIDIDIFFSPWPSWLLAQTLIDWNFMWNNLAAPNKVVYQNCPPPLPKQAGGPKPLPINNPPPPPPPPHQGPDRPIDVGPPVVIVTPPICPPGTIMSDGACRLSDPCRGGTIRVGNACVPPIRPDPLPRPPIHVINDPCANLSGVEFQRCIRGNPTGGGGDSKPPVTGPVVGTGDTRPVGNQPSPNGGQTGHSPVGGPLGVGNPDVRSKQPVQPSNRLPSTISAPMRTNPNPVVLGPGSGGLNKTTVGANQQASNNAVAAHHTLPVALPKRGQTVAR